MSRRRAQASQDDTFSSKRYLRRQWKLFKPHLQRSESLPDYALLPYERPLFTCENCNFSNKIIDLCLWCPFKANAKVNSNNKCRRRRVSAPALILCWQPLPTRPKIKQERLLQAPRSIAIRNLLSVSANPVYSESYAYHGARSTGAKALDTSIDSLGMKPPSFEENVNIPDDTVLQRPVNIVANLGCGVVTPQPEAQSFATSSMLTPLHSVDPDASCHQSYLGVVSVRDGLKTLHGKTFGNNSSSNHSTAGCTPANGTVDITPTPPLRRKKSYLILHMSTPPSKSANTWTVPSGRQRPQSQPAASDLTASASPAITQSLWLPVTSLDHHMRARARTQPDLPQLHLGHPSRPYYTALRKKMSPPSLSILSSSPQSVQGSSSALLSFPRVSSPVLQPPYPASFSDDSFELSGAELSQFLPLGLPVTTSSNNPPFIPFGIVLPSPSANFTFPVEKSPGFQFRSIKDKFRRNSDTTKFSKSDEMKLRLALAREVGGAVDVGSDEGFVNESRVMENVKLHMRRLSRGLKDFVNIKRRS
ncbi:hypothetical protein F5050DRAFT_391873 [Lentinula boryana]|uniref:Uncharacterized protein n=1 Tax=Lentinula boryana TaxID=40481 RepID=A0ABQ8Q8P0_9AGAR|nr:hypothetical protein F5050DRAFT_391873 [Lentinula boryana]